METFSQLLRDSRKAQVMSALVLFALIFTSISLTPTPKMFQAKIFAPAKEGVFLQLQPRPAAPNFDNTFLSDPFSAPPMGLSGQ